MEVSIFCTKFMIIYNFILHLVNSLCRQNIDTALVKMIATDMQPPSIVENKGFQDFLKVIDNKYIPPSCRTIMRDRLPSLYSAKKKELKELLALTEYCFLTSDLWTSRSTNGYLTVT